MNRKTSLGLTVVSLAVLVALFTGMSIPLRGAEDSPKDLTGSWDITITGTPFRILRTFAPGGGVVDAYAFPPFTPTVGPLINTAGHGAWAKTGEGLFTVTVQYFQLDPRENASFKTLNSIGKVRETIHLGPHSETYTSVFVTDVFLPDGKHIITNAGKTEGKRIKAVGPN